MGELIRMPPRGVGFTMPEPPVGGPVIAESIPEPLLPAVSSRMLHYSEHMDAVVKDLPDNHPAKNLGVFANIETRIQNLQETVGVTRSASKAKLVTAAGLGVTGFGVIGDAFLGGAIGPVPFAIMAGLGLATGIYGLGTTAMRALTQRQIDERDQKLETELKRRILSSERPFGVVPKNIELPNDADLQARIDAALNVQLPDVETINNTLPANAQLVKIPGAVITVGNDGSKQSDEGPAFTAVVSPFLVMECAVSNDLFSQFERHHNPGFNFDGGKQPAVKVTWNQAQAFIVRWNQLHPVPGMKWRLLREAEKDLIMRDGDLETIIDEPSHDSVNWSWKYGTLDVDDPKFKGRYVYHGRGNVWEWCEDGYGEYPRGVVINYRGVKNSRTYVLRGNAWNSVAVNSFRAAYRLGISANLYYNYVGFRLVLAPEDRE